MVMPEYHYLPLTNRLMAHGSILMARSGDMKYRHSAGNVSFLAGLFAPESPNSLPDIDLSIPDPPKGVIVVFHSLPAASC
jgi:hypothetical protein